MLMQCLMNGFYKEGFNESSLSALVSEFLLTNANEEIKHEGISINEEEPLTV